MPVVRAASPMQLGAQQPVVVMACGVQECDPFRGGPDAQPVTRLELPEDRAVTGHLRPRIRPFQQFHFNLGARGYDNGAV